MLSGYGKREWITILAIAAMLTVTCVTVGWAWAAIPIAVITVSLLSFFRDPARRVPTQRGVIVSPADGRVSSVHEVEYHEPFDGPATCIRIFLSVLNVHVNRAPCHGVVEWTRHSPGKHLNALNPESAEVNESVLMLLVHPVRRYPVATVRQVAGLLARTIVCPVEKGQVLQRGQRYGMIKFGSTTELYLPGYCQPDVVTRQGQKVKAGETILATVAAAPAQRPTVDNPPLDQETERPPASHESSHCGRTQLSDA